MPDISRRRFLTGAATIGAAAGVAAVGPHADAATPRSASAGKSARTGTIKDVKHVVVVMQENRSFDHYYGSLGGVRGFGDTTALTYPDGSTIFQQPDPAHTDGVLLPWHMDTSEVDAQDAGDLDHGWEGTHQAWNKGLWNDWVAAKSEQTMGHFTRADLPWQYALADAFTVCDHYFCSIQGPTTPNRLFHWSGTIDPGGTRGGPVNYNPADYEGILRWKTYPERLQAAGVSWQVFANDEVGDDGAHPWVGDYGDNPLWLFKAYHDALASSDPAKRQLAARANVADGWKADSGKGRDVDHVLSQFIDACASGTLPTVSWVVAPYLWSEHPLGRPIDGGAYVQRVLSALWDQPDLWESTAVILNFDENDGYFDHVVPPTPPAGTPGEFIDGLPIGLGPRVPAMVVSPWSRGGWVDSQVFDHTSVLRFLELVTGVEETNISAWRRAACGDLSSAFDFTSFDPSIPTLPDTAALQAEADRQKRLPGAKAPTGTQEMPTQESTTRRSRRLPYQPEATVSVDRTAGTVTAKITNSGSVPMSFATYPNAHLPQTATPSLVRPGKTDRYVWDATATDGAYDFSIHAADGFLRRFAGVVAPVSAHGVAVPAVTSSPVVGSSPSLAVTLSNTGAAAVTFTLTSGVDGVATRTVTVAASAHKRVSWPTDHDGRYDVTVTAAGGFAYRLAGRISPS